MVVHLSSVYHFSQIKGGNERYTSLLAHGLVKKGIALTYISSSPKPHRLPYTYTRLPINHVLKKPIPGKDWFKTQRPRPSVFHATGSGLPIITLARAYQQHSIPTVLTFQGPYNPGNAFFKLAAMVEQNLLNRVFDAIITTSPGNLSYLKQRFPSLSLYHIPLCSTPLPPPQKPFKPAPARPKKPYQIFMVAALDSHHYYKGVDIALKAIAKLPSHFHLNLVGSGPLTPLYQRLAQSLGVSEKITFHQQVKDAQLQKLYRQAHVYIQPSTSNSEGFGLSLTDAMAHRVPTITTTVIGLATTLKQHQASQLIPPQDPQALAQAIIKQALHPNIRQINNASKFARSLTQANMVQQTLKVYQQLISHPK